MDLLLQMSRYMYNTSETEKIPLRKTSIVYTTKPFFVSFCFTVVLSIAQEVVEEEEATAERGEGATR